MGRMRIQPLLMHEGFLPPPHLGYSTSYSVRWTWPFAFQASTNISPAPGPTNGTEGYVTSFSIQCLKEIGGSTSKINKQSDFSFYTQASAETCQVHYLPPSFKKRISTIYGLCANFVNRLLSLTYGCTLSFIYEYETWAFLHETTIKGLPIP